MKPSVQNNVQDTAAQVAAMTAALSKLADDMLPEEELEAQGKQSRQNRQDSKADSKDLRQQLLESWEGKVKNFIQQSQHGMGNRVAVLAQRE